MTDSLACRVLGCPMDRQTTRCEGELTILSRLTQDKGEDVCASCAACGNPTCCVYHGGHCQRKLCFAPHVVSERLSHLATHEMIPCLTPHGACALSCTIVVTSLREAMAWCRSVQARGENHRESAARRHAPRTATSQRKLSHAVN